MSPGTKYSIKYFKKLLHGYTTIDIVDINPSFIVTFDVPRPELHNRAKAVEEIILNYLKI